MRAATIAVIALLAFGGYHLYAGSGRMTAKELQAYLNARAPAWRLNFRMQCRADAAGKWDYICTDAGTGATYGYDVNRAGITDDKKLR
jgi:hypothetical protein